MDQPSSSQLPPPSSTTDNPVVAVGRKVKAALISHQQPSVRIRRDPYTTTQSSRAPVSKDFANAPQVQTQGSQSHADNLNQTPPNKTASINWFTRAKALFGGEKDSNDHVISTEHEYDSSTVDILDVLDPEVATLSTLTNVQNSLFVPQLGKFVNRRPTYRISAPEGETRILDKLKASLKRISSLVKDGDEKRKGNDPLPGAQYAVLPDGETLPGWTKQDKEELDDLVRHMLHSRRAKFKRSMKGFWQYVRRPLGLFITVYATLVTLFGAAWVFFLIGWISLGSKRDYIVNVVDNVLVALFAVIGDGLAPFRAVDTYHMIYIAYYHRKTHKRRVDSGLPKLADRNDLPEKRKEEAEKVDIESLVARRMPRGLARIVAPRIPEKLSQRMVSHSRNDDPAHEYTVLTEEEQTKLEYHERKFSKSHTFYKPHETETHYAFPLKLLIAVVILLDCHSALQISLGACTWGIPYETRPFALTTVILCFSITCNIMGGVLISMGDKRTRKKDVIERMMRQELTAEAIQEITTRQMKEAEERGELDPSVRKRLAEEREEKENQEIKKAWKGVPMLPKQLLGKGEDHRQPSLPQEARRSNSSVGTTTPISSTNQKAKSGSSGALKPVREDPSQPLPPSPTTKKGKWKLKGSRK